VVFSPELAVLNYLFGRRNSYTVPRIIDPKIHRVKGPSGALIHAYKTKENIK
jgi:hypothetical protein